MEALKSYGYATLQAANAGEALLIFERERGIHLVLTDVVMPNLSGREMAERLEKIRPGIKVLFMSGYNDDVITHQQTLEEPVHFIEKPFSPEELAEKVRAVLGTPAAARILVADDEAGVRRFLRQVLEQAGYEVIGGGRWKESGAGGTFRARGPDDHRPDHAGAGRDRDDADLAHGEAGPRDRRHLRRV